MNLAAGTSTGDEYEYRHVRKRSSVTLATRSKSTVIRSQVLRSITTVQALTGTICDLSEPLVYSTRLRSPCIAASEELRERDEYSYVERHMSTEEL